MNGAREYATLFPGNTQVGRLALISGSHARGSTFRIYVLPEGEVMSENGRGNPPLNKDAVEVYGIVGGSPAGLKVTAGCTRGNGKRTSRA
jgi:hypothetical protein